MPILPEASKKRNKEVKPLKKQNSVDESNKEAETDKIDPIPNTQEISTPEQSPISNQGQPSSDPSSQPDSIQSSLAAKRFPFKLDPFQLQAMLYLTENHNVFAAAHTSAGKTAIAEYAIALALSRKQRVIYTSPIKALSNQKYNDFKEEFGDVGLITGDVSLEPEATLLVCTTEILRNMLYRGSEILSEVSYVIFDEVHYMRDRERGTVWEESIVLLKANVTLLFLSATLSNAAQFARWVEFLKQRPCKVVSTDKRPVPLHFHLYESGKGLQSLATTGAVSEKVVRSLGNASGKDPRKSRGKGPREEGGVLFMNFSPQGNRNQSAIRKEINGLLKGLLASGDAPVIVFSFSRVNCDDRARAYCQYLDMFTSKHAKAAQPANSDKAKFENIERWKREQIDMIITNALSGFSEKDRETEQVQMVCKLLRYGVGVHHSGLLPVLRELVELLFCEELLSVLFATETFAMGVNMPAKTVIFSAISKWDGTQNRLLTEAEFTQMAGRAGRRGKDTEGKVIMLVEGIDSKVLCGGPPNPIACVKALQRLVKGAKMPLESSFQLSFNMVLNSTRVQKSNPTFLIENSFKHFQEKEALNKVQYSNIFSSDQEVRIAGLAEGFWESLKEGAVWTSGCSRRAGTGAEEDGGQGDSAGVAEESARFEINRETIQRSAIVFLEGAGFAVILGSRRRFSGEHASTSDIILDCAWLYFPELHPRINSPNRFLKETKLREPLKESFTAFVEYLHFFTNYAKNIAENTLRAHRSKSGHSFAQGARLMVNAFPASSVLGSYGAWPADSEYLIVRLDTSRRKGFACEELAVIASEIIFGDVVPNSFNLPSPKSDPSSLLKEKAKVYSQISSVSSELKRARSEETPNPGQTMLEKYIQELDGKTLLLKEENYLTADGLLLEKGRVASEISAIDEVLATEALFAGLFGQLTPEFTVSLLAALFAEDYRIKMDNRTAAQAMLNLAPETKGLIERFNELMRLYALIEERKRKCCAISSPSNGRMYLALGYILFAWIKGLSVPEISAVTKTFEGTIVRIIIRVGEVLNEMKAAAAAIGNSELQKRLEEGHKMIKKGIVFAGSLYM